MLQTNHSEGELEDLLFIYYLFSLFVQFIYLFIYLAISVFKLT